MQGITREDLILMVKKAGLEVCERAEDLVGNGESLADVDIWLRFRINEMPEIDVTRRHVSMEAIKVLIGRDKDA